MKEIENKKKERDTHKHIEREMNLIRLIFTINYLTHQRAHTHTHDKIKYKFTFAFVLCIYFLIFGCLTKRKEERKESKQANKRMRERERDRVKAEERRGRCCRRPMS